jgi:ketosteroid isomerase-like protein
MPTAGDIESVLAWVAAFIEGWQAPASADAFADHFEAWFDPHIRLIQPQLGTLVGRQAFRNRFARPLFTLIPDLHGQVERFAVGLDSAYVELRLYGTLGGRPITWRVCDRATLRDGVVIERESYFNPLPLMLAILARPSSWPAVARARSGVRHAERHTRGRKRTALLFASPRRHL